MSLSTKPTQVTRWWQCPLERDQDRPPKVVTLELRPEGRPRWQWEEAGPSHRRRSPVRGQSCPAVSPSASITVCLPEKSLAIYSGAGIERGLEPMLKKGSARVSLSVTLTCEQAEASLSLSRGPTFRVPGPFSLCLPPFRKAGSLRQGPGPDVEACAGFLGLL